MCGDVEARLQVQSLRMDEFSKSVQEARKESASNAETHQTLLVGMENLAENFRQMREDMLQWGNPE